jgi:predicted nucleotidyltransferase
MDARERVAELCSTFLERLLEILGDKLHGVYLYGAVAFPETTYTGDIDFHVILDGALTGDEVSAMTGLHEALARDFPPLGAELDGHYILLEDTRSLDPPTHQLREGVVDDSWALHCAHIRAGRCIALYGPDPRFIYPEPGWPEIEEALRGEMEYVEEHLDQYPDYCILNLCRLMYSYETRDVVVSKTAAAAWVLDAFPHWRRLIELAQASYAGASTPEDRRLMIDEVGELLGFAQERILTSRGAGGANAKQAGSGAR